MCSVSARPVMKITGTLLRPASRFSLRQVSKPSMPRITASRRMMSGVIWSTMRIAAAPSSATITVMPALSSASVSSRSVSGESSTTSATSRFLASMLIGMQRLQGCHVLIEIESIDQRAHLGDETGVLRMRLADLVELELDRPDIADLAKSHQLLDILQRRPLPALGAPERRGNHLCLISPFQLEELADRFQQARNVDRLHQVAVMERLCQRTAMRFQGACRRHQDAGVMVAANPQGFGDGPAVHDRHRDVEDEQ